MLFPITPVFWIYRLVVILVLLLLTAPLLRRRIHVARLPVSTTRPCCCMMWNITVLGAALNSQNHANKSSPKLGMGKIKRRLKPSIEFVCTEIIRTLTRWNPPITFHAATSLLTVTPRWINLEEFDRCITGVFSVPFSKENSYYRNPAVILDSIYKTKVNSLKLFQYQISNFALMQNDVSNVYARTHVAYQKYCQHKFQMVFILLTWNMEISNDPVQPPHFSRDKILQIMGPATLSLNALQYRVPPRCVMFRFSTISDD